MHLVVVDQNGNPLQKEAVAFYQFNLLASLELKAAAFRIMMYDEHSFM